MGRGTDALGAGGARERPHPVSTHAVMPAAVHVDSGEERSVDVVFDVVARTLPHDYRGALRDALCASLPWLALEPTAGIHALAPVTAETASLLVSRRTRLVLRVPATRRDDALQLCGRTLAIGAAALQIGAARVKALAPSATLGAAFVATMSDTDLTHQEAVEAMLDAAAIPRRLICGRLTCVRGAERDLLGTSVVVHELEAADSLRLQRLGLGPHRMLGCGLFVPYKSIGGIH